MSCDHVTSVDMSEELNATAHTRAGARDHIPISKLAPESLLLIKSFVLGTKVNHFTTSLPRNEPCSVVSTLNI